LEDEVVVCPEEVTRTATREWSALRRRGLLLETAPPLES
jgi:hypothetical protein